MTDDEGTLGSATAGEVKSRRILVIDDDRTTLKVIEKVLRQAGYEVMGTESERTGMTLFKEYPANVVLTDMFMAGRSGLELLRYFKELQPGVPVIILTGKLDFLNVTEALRGGAYDYLGKPFKADDLLKLVERALASSVPIIPQNREVLLVEPSPEVAEKAKSTLGDAGYEVLLAVNADQAEEIFTDFDVDVVISEIHLPGRSGLEFLAFCQKRRPEIPVVMTTRQADVNHAIESLRKGAFEFLLKPYANDLLRDTVRRAWERKALADVQRKLERERRIYDSKLEQLGRNLEAEVASRTQELGRLKRQSECMLNALPSGTLLIDFEGRVQAVNPPVLKLLKIKEPEIVGQSLDQIPLLADFQTPIRKTLESSQPVLRSELAMMLPGGQVRVLGYTLVPMRPSDLGQAMGVVLHIKDITEQKEVEQRVLHAQQVFTVEQVMKAQQQKLSELTSPILLGLESLKMKEGGESDERKELRVAVSALSAWVNDLCPEESCSTGHTAEVDINAMVQEIGALFEPDFRQRQVNLNVSPEAGPVLIRGSAYELRETLVLMMAHYRTSIPAGGSLMVNVQVVESTVTVTFQELGSYITSPPLDLVSFPDALRASPSNLSFAIARRILEGHAGSLALKNATGGKTILELCLPCHAT